LDYLLLVTSRAGVGGKWLPECPLRQPHISSLSIETPHTSHGRSADDELRREEHPAGSSVGVLEELEESAGRCRSLVLDALADRGERRVELSGEVQVVVAGEGDVFGNAQTVGLDRLECPGGGGVVGAEDGVDARFDQLG